LPIEWLIGSIESSRRKKSLRKGDIVQHYSRDALNRSNADHQEMIAAFACRDGAWAEALMATHVLRSYRTYADSHCNLTDDVQQEAAE